MSRSLALSCCPTCQASSAWQATVECSNHAHITEPAAWDADHLRPLRRHETSLEQRHAVGTTATLRRALKFSLPTSERMSSSWSSSHSGCAGHPQRRLVLPARAQWHGAACRWAPSAESPTRRRRHASWRTGCRQPFTPRRRRCCNAVGGDFRRGVALGGAGPQGRVLERCPESARNHT